ncbi:MAG: hypothetical protein K9M75_02595 [Phycisphaerae bacterium]|nr:hypothetical protein [Phycisphaerae bacterium]
MIIMLMTAVCSTSMAGISSGSNNSWYDDLLELLNLYRDRDVRLDDKDIYNDTPAVSYTDDSQSYPSEINSDIDVDLDDLPLTEPGGNLDGIIDPGQNGSGNPDSPVISNPEPCSIILSSIGLGIAGYLKRRRAI